MIFFSSNYNKSILVIGGAGYIGSHIVLDLCDRGYDVTVFDNLSSGFEENIDQRAHFVVGDILNEEHLKNVFKKKYCAVFHLAALKAAGDSMQDISAYSRVNISGTINILNQMVENDIDKIIFSSTAAVYGDPQYIPIDEKHALSPINFYGFTKLEVERMLFWYSSIKGIKFVTLRYFNAAGYDFKGRIKIVEKKPANLLPLIMETALGLRKFISVYGNDYPTLDGTCIRDYIHVSDLVNAHIDSLDYLIRKGDSIYLNLGAGRGYSVLDVIENAQSITKKEIKYKFVEKRIGDSAKMVSKYNLAKELIDWKPKFSEINTIIDSMWRIYSNFYNK